MTLFGGMGFSGISDPDPDLGWSSALLYFSCLQPPHATCVMQGRKIGQCDFYSPSGAGGALLFFFAQLAHVQVLQPLPCTAFSASGASPLYVAAPNSFGRSFSLGTGCQPTLATMTKRKLSPPHVPALCSLAQFSRAIPRRRATDSIRRAQPTRPTGSRESPLQRTTSISNRESAPRPRPTFSPRLV